MKRVLVIAPHMDDEVLGCGGTIASHVDRGDNVEVLIVCHRVYDRVFDPDKNSVEKANAKVAQKILGYANARFLDLPDERLHGYFQELLDGLESVIKAISPQLVYAPHAGDLHQDHRTVAHAANIATRALLESPIERVLAYEVPSSTEQAFAGAALPFLPNVFVNIEQQLERKVGAMAAYERESRRFPHPRSPELLEARARFRGGQCGRSAAEAFMLLRETLG